MLDFHCIIVVQYLICKNLLFYQAGSTALIINLGYIQDGPKKVGPQTHDHNSVKS